jgi:cellulose synthase operon protein C
MKTRVLILACVAAVVVVVGAGVFYGAFGRAGDPLSWGQERLREGDLPGARIALRRAVRATPDDARAHFWLATVQLRLGESAAGERELAASLALFDRAVRQDPLALEARLERANLLIAAGQDARAMQDIDRVLRQAPHDARAAYMQAVLRTKAADFAGANAALRTIATQDMPSLLARFPHARRLQAIVRYALGQPEQAVPAATGDRAPFDPATGRLLVRRLAAALASAGHAEQAAQCLQAWLVIQPDDLDSRTMLVSLALAAHLNDVAETNLKAVLELRPDDPISLNNLAWVEQRRGGPAAEALARKAYALSPGGAAADTLGWILTSHADPAGLGLLRIASGELPDNGAVQYHLAVALDRAGQRDAAIAVLQSAAVGAGEFEGKADARRLLASLVGGP